MSRFIMLAIRDIFGVFEFVCWGEKIIFKKKLNRKVFLEKRGNLDTKQIHQEP